MKLNSDDMRKAERAYRRDFPSPPSRKGREKAFQAECASKETPPAPVEGMALAPCGIAVDVDIETGEGSICPYPTTHKAALVRGKWLHACQLHGARLQQVGVVVKPL